MGWVKNNLRTVIIFALVGGIVAFYAGIKVADMPFFCGMLCHEMQPHVDSLKSNLHSKKGVVCMDCHSEQGFFNRAAEHIKALSLLGGHFSKVYLEDEFDLHKNVKGFNKEEMDFNHKNKEEHDKIAKECLNCHPVRLVSSYFMFQPEHKDKMVNKNCHRCHEEVVQSGEKDIEEVKAALMAQTEKPTSIGNIHPIHIKKNIMCTSCHNRVVHNTNPSILMIGMDNCMGCHNGKNAPLVDCNGCHNGPKDLFAGTGTKDVIGSSGLMAEEDCSGCHDENEAFKYSDALCVSCHEEDYADMRKEWQASYADSLTKTTKNYSAVKTRFEKARAEERIIPELEETFKKIEYNYFFVVNDRSKGVHNNEFTDSIFEDIETKIAELKEAIQ